MSKKTGGNNQTLAADCTQINGFENSNRLLNHKRKRFKVFEVKSRSNHDDVIINLIIILNIYKNVKLVKNRKIN